MFEIAEIGGEQAATVVAGFAARIDETPSVLRNHSQRPFAFDGSASMAYQGTILRAGGAEASEFHIAKPDAFFIVLQLPAHGESYFPTILIAGDVRQAKAFLMAFQKADGEWI